VFMVFTRDEALQIVADIVGEPVTDDTSIIDDLALDSLDFVMILEALESEFDVTSAIEYVEEAKMATTIGGLIDYVETVWRRKHGIPSS